MQKMCCCTFEIALFSNLRALWVPKKWVEQKLNKIFFFSFPLLPNLSSAVLSAPGSALENNQLWPKFGKT